MSYDLYDGLCGVALFLAQLTVVSGLKKYKDLCFSTLKFLRSALNREKADRALSKYIGIGYSLLRLAAPDKIPPVLLWM